MDTESRVRSSAGNKKSDQNPHLSYGQLLLTLDGESAAHEAAKVEVHLEACWSCRARREQIEEAIAGVVEYRDLLAKSFVPLSTGGRARFVAQLQQLVQSVGRPSLRSRVVAALRAFSQGVVPRHVWISGLITATFGILLFTRPWEVPKVSASQVLENAQVSEVRALHSVAKPVVYQKLSIRVGSQAVMRTIYRDLGGMRQADHLDLSGSSAELPNNVGLPSQRKNRPESVHSAKNEIQEAFLAARLNWQDPLSPARYRDWHINLSEKQDEVSLAGNNLTLTTTTADGPITEARLTVRTSDFHPIAVNLRLRDTRQVEVNELAWEVLPMEAINPAIFAPETPLPAEIGRPSSVTPQPPGLTDAQLAEAELRARVAIHAEKADLGEQIELDRDIPRSGQRSVVVRGIVSTPERKNDLLAVLRGIPHVDLRLETVEEAQSQQNQVTADMLQGAAPQIAQEVPVREYRVAGASAEATRYETPALVIAGRPALEQQLEGRFPISEDRAAFINETVELVQDAMAQAWALRRLANRYTPGMVTELSSGSQQTLELLIRDHVSVLRHDVDGVRNRVSPLLSPAPVAAVPLPPTPNAPLPAAALANDWRSTVLQVFSKTQRVHDNSAALLAGSEQAPSAGQTVVRDLQLALADLETQLPALYQQVSGPFLSEVKNSVR